MRRPEPRAGPPALTLRCVRLSLLLGAIGAFALAWLGLRWWLFATRDSRRSRAQSAPISNARRLPAALELPVFVALVALVVAVGLMTAVIIGPH
jgi:hypothetical protein